MEYAKCVDCGQVYGYFDSPSMDNCSCGGKLDISIEVWAENREAIFNNQEINYATVSC